MPNINNLTTQDQQWGAALWSSKGYIDGLTMQWVSGTALTVTTGTAYIESEQRLIPVTSAIAKTGLSLTASTLHHVYLYLNAGVPDVEIVTTAPASPYSGTARSKAGDTSRRYVGSVLVDASGNLYRFSQTRGEIHYLATIGSGTPFRILSNGSATTPTAVSASAVVPVTATRAEFQFINNTAASGPFMIITHPSSTDQVVSIPQVTRFTMYYPVVDEQVWYFMYAGTGTGSAYIDVHAYTFER